MAIEFPKIDYLLSNKMEKLSKEQLLWSELLTLHESIINSAIKDYVGLEKDNCQEMYFSVFLDSLYYEIQPYLFGKCKNKFLFDDFIFVASVAGKAIKAIVTNPSTRIIKVDEQKKYNKITNVGIKTMQWLAKRQGGTIREKISPQNKVLTVSTKFTVDTKENEASMYLYNIIYRIIASRLFGSECKRCETKNCKNKRLLEEMLKIYSLNTGIMQSELHSIPKIRHSVQNNKLMCDKYYKVIWDCNTKISRMEKGLKIEWDNLLEILYADIYYCVLAILMHDPSYKYVDTIGRIMIDDKGRLLFSNSEKFKFILSNNGLKELRILLHNNMISVEKSMYKFESDSTWKLQKKENEEFDLSIIQAEIDRFISQSVCDSINVPNEEVIIDQGVTEKSNA